MAQAVESSEFLHNRLALKTTAGVLDRHVQPAEVAQARLFEGILQSEFAQLHRLADRMAGSLDWQHDLDGHEVPRDLLRIHARIDEIHRLLQALRGRFPQSGRSPDVIGAV